MNKRRVIATSLSIFLLFSSTTLTGASTVNLYIDTNKIDTDTAPIIVDGRTLVPVRAIFEALGATVAWDQTTKTATGTLDDTTVTVQIDSKTAYVNDEAKTLDVAAKIINNRTMVPARFVSEALGCKVTWDAATGTAAVAKELKDQPLYVTKTGKRYHYDSSCNGGNYYEATLAQVTGRNLTPCNKCIQ